MFYMHGEGNIAGWNAGLIADVNRITILRPMPQPAMTNNQAIATKA